MSSEIYSGAIDWDKVYRAFHHPSRIAECILAELNGSADSVVFSGFAETASFLADKLPVTFVDYSPSVTARARERYPKLGEVLTGDVTQLLALLPATSVAIACRISAYWNSTEQFRRLANSVLAFTRERILIDFFDRDLVESGHSIAFNSVDGTRKWRFRDFKESVGVTPPFSTATLTVSYSLGDLNVGYEDHRSFFRRGVLQQWGRSMFPEPKLLAQTRPEEQDHNLMSRRYAGHAGRLIREVTRTAREQRAGGAHARSTHRDSLKLQDVGKRSVAPITARRAVMGGRARAERRSRPVNGGEIKVLF